VTTVSHSFGTAVATISAANRSVATAVSGAVAVAVAGPVAAGDVESRETPETTTPNGTDATLETNTVGEVTLKNGPRQTIGGETNAAPGTNLTVHVRSGSDTVDFDETFDATVRDDGTFEVTTDAFADEGSGLRFTAWVSRNETWISPRYDGVMLSYDPGSVVLADQRVTSPDPTVVVGSVTVSDGGFVSVRRESANGSVLGASDYLSAGMHENVSVDLDGPVSGNETLVAVLHRDSDGDERWDFPERDSPIPVGGSTIYDAATVAGQTPTTDTVGEPIPTPTPTPTPTPATTTGDAPTATESPSQSTESTETGGTADRTQPSATTGSGPGFGVATALLALLAAAHLPADRPD
jgi:PGF-CTERM protein